MASTICSTGSSSGSRPIVELYASLRKLCNFASGENGHPFSSAEEQLEFLFHTHLPSLETWYDDQFVPAMRLYEASTGKSAAMATKYKQFADVYGKMEHMASKTLESVNMVRHFPATMNLQSSLTFSHSFPQRPFAIHHLKTEISFATASSSVPVCTVTFGRTWSRPLTT